MEEKSYLITIIILLIFIIFNCNCNRGLIEGALLDDIKKDAGHVSDFASLPFSEEWDYIVGSNGHRRPRAATPSPSQIPECKTHITKHPNPLNLNNRCTAILDLNKCPDYSEKFQRDGLRRNCEKGEMSDRPGDMCVTGDICNEVSLGDTRCTFPEHHGGLSPGQKGECCDANWYEMAEGRGGPEDGDCAK